MFISKFFRWSSISKSKTIFSLAHDWSFLIFHNNNNVIIKALFVISHYLHNSSCVCVDIWLNNCPNERVIIQMLVCPVHNSAIFISVEYPWVLGSRRLWGGGGSGADVTVWVSKQTVWLQNKSLKGTTQKLFVWKMKCLRYTRYYASWCWTEL